MHLTDHYSNLIQLKEAFFQLFDGSVEQSERAAQFYWWAKDRLNLTHKDFLLYPDQPVAQDTLEQIQLDFKALKKGTPLQYVLGQVNFLGLDLMVGPGVLIPRPETEELVQRIMASGPFHHILDVGTGSGCIALKLKQAFTSAAVTAIDISKEALSIAQQNCQRHQLQVELLHADFCDVTLWPDLPEVDLLVSNPPYIPLSEAAQMESNVLDFEPHVALFVPNQDPVLFYRNLLDFATQHLKPQGAIWAEIHYNQAAALTNLAESYAFTSVNIYDDFFGKPRFLHIKK